MRLDIRSSKNLWAGLLFMAIGVAAVVISFDYDAGSATRMGPAYFPRALGAMLAVIGLVIALRSGRNAEPIGAVTIKGLLLVLAGVALFCILVQGAGLLIAMPAMVLVAAAGSTLFKPLHAIILAIGMTTFSALVFVKGLGVPLRLLGSWFGG